MMACMNRALIAELEKLDADERLRLAYDLLDSVANDTPGDASRAAQS